MKSKSTCFFEALYGLFFQPKSIFIHGPDCPLRQAIDKEIDNLVRSDVKLDTSHAGWLCPKFKNKAEMIISAGKIVKNAREGGYVFHKRARQNLISAGVWIEKCAMLEEQDE